MPSISPFGIAPHHVDNRWVASLCLVAAALYGTSAPAAPARTLSNAMVGATGAMAIAGGMGVRVYAQSWIPTHPDQDAPRLIVNEPTIVTRALSSAWDAARSAMTRDLPIALGRGDLIAPGITLYNLQLTTAPLAGVRWTTPNGWVPYSAPASEFGLTLTIPNTQITFTSTTPDTAQASNGKIPVRIGVGSYGDPSGYIQLDLQIDLQVAFSNTPGRTLLVKSAHVLTSNLRIGPTNLAGDLYTTVANWLGIHYQQMADAYFNNCNLVQGPQGTLPAASPCARTFDFVAEANDALQPLDNAIRIPAGLVQEGANIKPNPNQSGSSLVLLFAQAPLPPPAGGGAGTLSGLIHVNASADAKVLPVSCDDFDVPAAVSLQVGPRPVSNLEPLQLGAAPFAPLLGLRISATGGTVRPGGQCGYRLAGLVPGWRHRIAFASAAPPSAGSTPAFRETLMLVPANWTSPLIAGVSTPNHDLTANSAFVGSGGVGVRAQALTAAPNFNSGDPYTRSTSAAARRAPNWSAPAGSTAAGATGRNGRVNAPTSSFVRAPFGQTHLTPAAAPGTTQNPQ